METLHNMVKANGGLGSSPGTLVPPVSSPSTPAVLPRRHVDPHSVVQKKKLSKAARAVLGAEILDGNVALLNPTRDMVSKAVGVSTGYIDAARRRKPGRKSHAEIAPSRGARSRRSSANDFNSAAGQSSGAFPERETDHVHRLRIARDRHDAQPGPE
jgi:hypothetical protein